jgi:hypothetical protein
MQALFTGFLPVFSRFVMVYFGYHPIYWGSFLFRPMTAPSLRRRGLDLARRIKNAHKPGGMA